MPKIRLDWAEVVTFPNRRSVFELLDGASNEIATPTEELISTLYGAFGGWLTVNYRWIDRFLQRRRLQSNPL
jgi:hypothetical protein